MEIPLGFVVLKGEGHVVLVDSGFQVPERPQELEERYGVISARSSDRGLAMLGIEPQDVDTILLTHSHWDHMGNLAAFPNATLYLQERELFGWMTAFARPERFDFLRGGVDPSDFQHLFERSLLGQVRLVNGGVTDVLPGVDLVPAFDTHTYGSEFVVINPQAGADGGCWVAAGDCVFAFENLEGPTGSGPYIPIGQATGSQERILEVFEDIMVRVNRNASRVIPVHDSAVWTRFPSSRSDDGLHIAEVALAPGEISRLEAPAPRAGG
jgi:glyoxylase-like metal-dependent hydrolase (beta-lactamase superfamily II)